MNVNDTVLISSKVVQLILVPILRELAAVLLAIAISKDCKARDNGSGTLHDRIYNNRHQPAALYGVSPVPSGYGAE